MVSKQLLRQLHQKIKLISSVFYRPTQTPAQIKNTVEYQFINKLNYLRIYFNLNNLKFWKQRFYVYAI